MDSLHALVVVIVLASLIASNATPSGPASTDEHASTLASAEASVDAEP